MNVEYSQAVATSHVSTLNLINVIFRTRGLNLSSAKIHINDPVTHLGSNRCISGQHLWNSYLDAATTIDHYDILGRAPFFLF